MNGCEGDQQHGIGDFLVGESLSVWISELNELLKIITFAARFKFSISKHLSTFLYDRINMNIHGNFVAIE